MTTFIRTHSVSKGGFSDSMALTAEQEREISFRATALLDEVEQALAAHPRALRVLKNDTHSERIDALRSAVGTLPSPAPHLVGLLDMAHALHWKLALSGMSLLRWEVARIKVPAAEREDISQHGYAALLKAARRFDPSRELRFSTYARWWVRAEMQEAMGSHRRLVRLPSSAIEARGRLMEIVEHLRAQGQPIIISELAHQVDISPRQVRLLLRQGAVQSIEEEVNGVPLAEQLAEEPACEQALIDYETKARVRDLLKQLPEREQEIICRHYGLNGYKKESLTAIGRRFNLSRERVRQIEKLSLQGMAAHLD